ncbi:SRPBCC family protein [Microbacterium sp. BWT-B31]|uniref:SRPBCC family protein n=1 Tax=Microbacterium sp. BWT-B31 TaxID=3232072 RepID=UPI003527D5C1
MELHSSFTVDAPIEEVWTALMDVERIATAVPGAELTAKLSDTSYQGVVKVKVGPLTMQYRGQIDLVSRDDATHTAVFRGKAQEKAGQGTAEGTATLTLTQDGDATTGAVQGSVALSGKAAAMGKGIIDKVAQQIMAIFAANLQSMLSGAGEATAGESDGGAVNGLSIAAGVIGSMFHRDKGPAPDSE